ncbi:MAG: protein-tyrosine-phosphatase [Bacteroidia bacterium]
MKLYSNLKNSVNELIKEFDLITEVRKQELENIALVIEESITKFGKAEITVICTHNSRRSQLGQLWIKVAANYYNIKNIYTFSGGTEATSFNYRMVNAVKEYGFKVKQLDENTNPKYHIPLAEEDESMDILYSKVYLENYNPQTNFIAIMVCTHADEGCPFVAGAFKRISLPYLDPKEFDDTELESIKYLEKVKEIGREMLYMFSSFK